MEFRQLAADLAERVDGEVRFDPGARATYSTDGSNYRRIPIGVVLPHTPQDAAAAIAVCAEHDAPVVSRGGGTSLAGQCCNAAVVIDWTKYCHRVISVDAAARTAVVEPGIALDELNAALVEYGLMVGPKPSTHVSCTIGGMIGNNSCGSTAQAYGKMVDAVRRLEILTYEGLQAWVGPTPDHRLTELISGDDALAGLLSGLVDLRDRYEADVRAGYPDIPRRVSGYNLDALLPEKGFDLAQLIVGSESTLATVLRAELALVPIPRATALAVLGFGDVFAAADAVPAVLAHEPAALEGLDDRLIQLEHLRHLAEQAIGKLPDGHAWLMAQFNGDSPEEADQRAKQMIAELTRSDDVTATILDEPDRKAEIWAAREAGLGATAYPPDGSETHEGWEDAAVPPARLGEYLRDFRRLLDRYGYGSSSLYGHFGHGCVHTRIPFDLRTAEGVGRYRDFVTEAARLVSSYGGSLSGEHGDGQSRGELLPIMYGDRIVRAFEELKDLFDPRNRMNPGKVVRPRRLDDDLRLGTGYRPTEPKTVFSFPSDGNLFSAAAARCVGVGKCRGHEGGVMCPSYRVTREEEHSTRGRARLLFEMTRGEVITDGWRSTEVRDALDLCLACKGCRSDCPVDVDMATYKAEFLHHHYRHRPRPAAHYSMGWLPLLARAAAIAPRALNTLAHRPTLSRVAKAAGGVDTRRELPRFAAKRFTDTYLRPADRLGGARGTVMLWPDTFTNNFEPEIAYAAAHVLTSAGFDVQLPPGTLCCGLTWISTGQLGIAKRVLRRTLRILDPQLRAGTPIVVLEPSCAAVFRSDGPELLYGDEDANRLADQTRTLGELLTERAADWRPPRQAIEAMVQPHCHQHAILKHHRERETMAAFGVDATVLDAGCCGLAGNFGFERGHYEVSVACAEDKLMPAVRARKSGTAVVADGFSCRTQIRHLQPDAAPQHTAQLLAAILEQHE